MSLRACGVCLWVRARTQCRRVSGTRLCRSSFHPAESSTTWQTVLLHMSFRSLALQITHWFGASYRQPPAMAANDAGALRVVGQVVPLVKIGVAVVQLFRPAGVTDLSPPPAPVSRRECTSSVRWAGVVVRVVPAGRRKPWIRAQSSATAGHADRRMAASTREGQPRGSQILEMTPSRASRRSGRLLLRRLLKRIIDCCLFPGCAQGRRSRGSVDQQEEASP
jgi:hypothetical protein